MGVEPGQDVRGVRGCCTPASLQNVTMSAREEEITLFTRPWTLRFPHAGRRGGAVSRGKESEGFAFSSERFGLPKAEQRPFAMTRKHMVLCSREVVRLETA